MIELRFRTRYLFLHERLGEDLGLHISNQETYRRKALVTREVDETALDIGVDQLDADSVAHVQALKAALQPALRWRLEDADPCPFR